MKSNFSFFEKVLTLNFTNTSTRDLQSGEKKFNQVYYFFTYAKVPRTGTMDSVTFFGFKSDKMDGEGVVIS